MTDTTGQNDHERSEVHAVAEQLVQRAREEGVDLVGSDGRSPG